MLANFSAICFVTIFLCFFVLFAVKFTSTDLFVHNYSTKMVRDFKYPIARRDESVADNFHGTTVSRQNMTFFFFVLFMRN